MNRGILAGIVMWLAFTTGALLAIGDQPSAAQKPCPCNCSCKKKPQKQTTSVSPNCVITIDGEPAKLEDIKGLDAIITVEVTKIAAKSKKL